MTRHLQSVPGDGEPWEYPVPEGRTDSVAKSDLAAAAADAATDDGATGQQALIPRSVTRFVGMKLNTTDDVPELRARVAYLVIGEVNGHATEVMADGDDREVAKVKVESVKQVEIGATVTVE
jgi:hypothetical protein